MIYQVTFHNKCSKCPQSESLLVRTRPILDFTTIQLSRGGCERCVIHEKCAGEVSLFKLELNAQRILSVPTEKHVKA
jgi:hypothetical protein